MLNLLPKLAKKRVFSQKKNKIWERKIRTKTDCQVAETSSKT